MKLRQVRVRNYRSIVDSGTVDIEKRVTVLIGKNEQGKTTFQKALQSLNNGVTYSPKDLPNHLRAGLEKTPADQIAIIDAWFSLDELDGSKLESVISAPETLQGLHVTKYYSGDYSYATVSDDNTETKLVPRPPDIALFVKDIKRQAETLRTKLSAHAERLPAFAASIEQSSTHIDALLGANFDAHEQIDNLVKTFGTGMTGVPGQDAAIQEDVASTITSIAKAQVSIQKTISQDFYAPLRAALPRFVFHSTGMDRIPDFIGIADFVASPEATSKGMANLCAVAGLSTQKIQQLAAIAEAAERETFEDHYQATISGGINEFWTQERYTVGFRFDALRLSVSIKDDTYSPRIAPSDRSDGFQWYLSFYAALLSEVSRTDPMVLLLDNPGLELHADGQHDIKRFLEQKLPSPAQVIYVTHSSAMIDPFKLEQVRQVELHGDFHGTKVRRLAVKEGTEFDLLEPARSAIGATLASSLIFNELNVLVEGAADKPLLEAAFLGLVPEDSKRILINGSISESNGLLARFYKRGNLPLVAFLDADSGARDLRKLLKTWGLDDTQIVDLSQLFEREGDFELEDILSEDYYHRAVTAAYPDQAVDRPGAFEGKRTKHYERAYREKHKIGFAKRRAADAAKRLFLEGNADAESSNNLRKVIDAILKALHGQVK